MDILYSTVVVLSAGVEGGAGGGICPPEDMWQGLETFLVVTTERVPLTFSG